MRKLLLVLVFFSFVFAKDNFIYESYQPSEIEKRLESIEKQLKILREYVSVSKAGKVVIKKSDASNSALKNDIGSLQRAVGSLRKDVSNLQNSQGATSSKILSKKMTELEGKIANLETPKTSNGVKSSEHDSMRIDILDEKISNLEKKMNRLQIDVGSASTSLNVDGLLKNPLIEYTLIGLAFVILLIFAMVISAMSRAKEAISRANRVADAIAKSSRKKEEPQSSQGNKPKNPQEPNKEISQNKSAETKKEN